MKTTESDSLYNNLETKSVQDLISSINQEDQKVAKAVELIIPQISAFVEDLVARMKLGGKLYYIGAGTSGRLGILDASEIPPTFGADPSLIVGLIAGGDKAIRKAVENAEDDVNGAWRDLESFNLNENDTLIGIAASGSTPYVMGGLKKAQESRILTACISCNQEASIAKYADHKMIAIVGPEFVTGSTRMKAGTAQKLILNMISTTAMIQLGKVKGNKMVDMQLSNAKLVDRGSRMIAEELGISKENAEPLLLKYGSVRKAIEESQKKARD